MKSDDCALSMSSGQAAEELLCDERMHEQFVASARRTPDAVALSCGGISCSYRELDALTDHWSTSLRALGVGPGTFVGVWLTRSIALHAAVLAVLKAGATYLPFDDHAPVDRVATCLTDCGATLILVDAEQGGRACSLTVQVVDVSELDGDAAPSAPVRPPGDQAAYVIYTSGSTGKPKGVAVSHASISHLLRAENILLGVTAADVVYAGFSAAFDMSIEEVFISYLVGASLVIATADQIQAVDRLPGLLTQHGVTVLHCVPTLLSMLENDVPGLRLINLGGEPCPPALVDRWWRAGRRLTNTYGPTETTITATLAELRAGEPVTVGRPLPNYVALVIDENGRPVELGTAGELCIGGPGVALGYVNRPELTAKAFVPMPDGAGTMYRTGDRATIGDDGRIWLLGRFDTQVKHRGFRIELGEIEAELSRLTGVRACAVVLNGHGADKHLAAYVVALSFDPKTLRTELSDKLPSYMIPAVFHPLDALPQLPSGKTDRKALPDLPPPSVATDKGDEPLLSALQRLFPHSRVGPQDDFFNDLGGHSLLAAALVSALRKHPQFATISLQDLYELRTAERIASHFASVSTAPPSVDERQPIDRRRYFLCSLAQAALLPIVFTLASAEFLMPYLAFDQGHDTIGWAGAIGLAAIAFILIPPAIAIVAVALKWLVLGRVRPGRHRLWGSMYLRWWFVSRVLAIVTQGVLADTPLMAGFYRLLGARVGPRAHLGNVETSVHDLVEIGADASIGTQAMLATASVERGWLCFGTVQIGERAHVGSSSVLERDTVIEDDGELASLSLLPRGATVEAGALWAGSPAARCGMAKPPPPSHPGKRQVWAATSAFALIALILMPLLNLLPIIPSLAVLEWLQDEGPRRSALVVLAPVIALAYTLLVVIEVTLLRWAVLGRVREGKHGTMSLFFVRKWTVDRLMELSLSVLHPIYATMYAAPFFRALGAKVGRGAEISTAASVTHDLLEIGEGAFIADMVKLGDPEIRGGRLILKRTTIGNRTFVGNCALVPDGSRIPDNVLVGCLSVPPDTMLEPGQTCLGSPAFILPRRQQSTSYDAKLLFRPGLWQIVQRLVIEGGRILLPRGAVFAAICFALDAFEAIASRIGFWPATLWVPLLYVGLFGVPGILGVVAIKWALVGRYRPAEYPMWSRPVWLSEAVTAIYEGLTVPLIMRHLRGTVFLPMAFRLFGVKIGWRTWMDSTDITEFDLVTIEDEAEINADAGPQTHLFEDRVMKLDTVRLGARSTMGANSIALPGARLEPDARLGPLSLVMKGETIPAGPIWAGSPARCRS